MDSAACGSFAVLLLRRNCCEKHWCEEDCCEGTVENGLRRTGCCEEDHCEWTLLHVAHLLYSCCEGPAVKSMAAKRTAAKERLRTDCGERAAAKRTTENGLRRMACCEGDYGERTTEKGLLRRGRLRTDSAARGSSAVHIIAEWVHVHPQNSWPSRAQPWKAQNGTKVREGKRSPEMETCKPALSLATLLLLSCFSLASLLQTRRWTHASQRCLLLLSCKRGDGHMSTRR